MTAPTDSHDSLLADQRRRWAAGDPAPAETYLADRPGLHAEAALDLIYNEVVLREERGEVPTLTEYVARFPQFADQLRMQFDVHRAIESGSLVDSSATVPGGGSDADFSVTPATAAEPPTGLPGYDLVRELGRGGMGVVYEAVQRGLKRQVALKMVLAGAHAGPKERARFRTEAEAVARLGHPNIVQVFEVGEHDGRPFLALELVPGGSLADSLKGAPQPPARAARLVAALADAVHDAHSRGVVHRDLKPSNVLLAADGTPKLTDFGLAKLLDAEGGPTATDAFLGTPSYAAPEQALGQARDVGPAADVYSLGAILYECLTGRPPFRGATPLDTLAQVRSQEPVPPRRLQPSVPMDLETVCLKCLEKEPDRRYASAADLAADLRRFLAGEPVRARPVPPWRVAAKWAKRRPLAAAALAAAIVLLPALGGLGFWVAQHAEDIRRQSDRAALTTFLEQRDEAVYHGLFAYDPLRAPDGAATHPAAATDGARRALAAVGYVPGEPPPARRHWTDRETSEVTASCYQLLLLLADAAVEENRPDEALRLLDGAARLLPPTPTYHTRRARALAAAGDAAGADAERRLADALPPTTALDLFLRGEEEFRRGEMRAAAADFERTLVLEPNHFWAKFLMAVCHLRMGRWAEARVGLADSAGHRSDFAGVYLLRGAAAAHLGDVGAADADFARAEALDPAGRFAALLHANRGEAYAALGRLADAERDLRRAIALEPGQFDCHVRLARVCRDTGRPPEAIAVADAALALDPPPAAAAALQTERAVALAAVGRPADAVAACNIALRLRPELADVHAVRGSALLALGDDGPAVDALTKALALGPTQAVSVRQERGTARFHLGDYAGAVADYSAVLDRRPRADVYLHRGWAYVFLDAWRLALPDFAAAAALDAAAAAAAAGADHALAAATAAAATAPAAGPLVGRALARAHLGDVSAAVADADAAAALRPATADLYHNLACAYAQAAAHSDGDLAARGRARAIEMLRKALDRLPAADRASYWREKALTEPDLAPLRAAPEFGRIGSTLP